MLCRLFFVELVCSFALFLNLSSVAAATIANACDQDVNIFVLDRTSIFNKAEVASFADGVKLASNSKGITGDVLFSEVKDVAFGFKSLNDVCIASQYIPSRRCAIYTEEEGAKGVAASIERMMRPSSIERERIATKCDEEKTRFLIEQEDKKKNIVDFMIETSRINSPVEHTNIMNAVFEILTSRCESKLECKLFLFSNLLDTNVKREIRRGKESNYFQSGVVAMHEVLKQSTVPFQNLKKPKIVVWGVGFSDADGEDKQELTPLERRSLITFWKGAFSVLTDDSTISFEMQH